MSLGSTSHVITSAICQVFFSSYSYSLEGNVREKVKEWNKDKLCVEKSYASCNQVSEQ